MYCLPLFLKKFSSLIIISLLSLTMLACESGNSNVGTNPTEGKGGVSLPRELKTALLTGGTLNAYIIVDGGNRQIMSINGDIAGINLSGLTEGMHTFIIEFEYVVTANPDTPLILARVSQDLNVGVGDNTLNIEEGDYDTSQDNDNDGRSNINELAAGENPFAGYIISNISGNTTEDEDIASFNMVLTRQPAADVNLDVSSSNTDEGVVDQASLTFTPDDWNEPQAVIVTGVDDDVIDGNISYRIILSAMTSNDINYNDEDPADINVTNVDNDSSGFNISPINRSTTENGGTASFTARLNTEPGEDVVINLSSSNTNEGTIDTAQLTFTSVNWSTPQTVTVTGQDDTVLDGNQSYSIDFTDAVSSDTNYNNLVVDSVSVLNLDNEGELSVSISTQDSSISETSGIATITATMSNASNQDVIVNLSYRGSASNADYTPVNAITIPGDSQTTSASIQIVATPDTIDEINEEIIVDISSVTNALASNAPSPVITIMDDDQLPVVTLDIASSATLSESVGSVKLTASINAASSRDVVVNLIYTGTATAGEDYTKVDSITIPAMALFTQVDFNITQDTIDEPPEGITIEVDTVTNGVEVVAQLKSISIEDDDAPSAISFTTASQTVAETVAGVTVSASLNTVSGFDVNVPYTVAGSAGSTDHNLADGSINIPAGQTSDTINFTVQNDTLVESAEDLVITLGTPVNATLGTTSTHTVSITDNDYSIGGSASGVGSLGLVLQNNAGDDLVVNGNGAFIFASGINNGDTYDVTIKSHPAGRSCAFSPANSLITDPSGTVNNANISSISVVCFLTNTLSALPQSNSVKLNWNVNGEQVFNIYYSTQKGFDPQNYRNFDNSGVISNITSQLETTALSRTVTGLENGLKYYFVLESVYFNTLIYSQEVSSRPDEWRFNGNVSVVELSSGGTRYIGGNFTSVGVYTGKAAPVDITTGKLTTGSFPAIEGGAVYVIESDNQGGWYLGGRFTVDGSPLKGLVHILADGSIDSNIPDVEGTVNALVVDNGIIYIGGTFRSIGGAPRENLAAIAIDGTLVDWSPSVNQRVNTLVVNGNRLYVGGLFSTVDGIARSRLAEFFSQNAAVSQRGALLLAWNPVINGEVYSIAVMDNTLYMGGSFTSVIGVGGTASVPRNRLAAISTADGSLGAWNPDASNTVYEIAIDGTTAYVGGEFGSIGGIARSKLASIKLTDGTLNTWDPKPSKSVSKIKVLGNVVYVGGVFTDLRADTSKKNKYVAAIRTDGTIIDTWQPKSDSAVFAIGVDGNTVYLGGAFDIIGAATRNRLASINTDGTLSDWNPDANGSISAMDINSSTQKVYIGGYFSNISGSVQSGIAAVSTAPSATLDTAFKADINFVDSLKLDDATGIVYVGGAFGSVNGQTRNGLVAFNADGSIDTRLNLNLESNAAYWVKDIAIDNGVVYIGGNFSGITNNTRNNLAAFTTAGALVPNWAPNVDNHINTLDIDQGVLYVGGNFTGIDGTVRNRLASINTADGSLTTWNPDAGVAGGVSAIMVDANTSTVYVGGGFTTIGGQARSGVAAIDNLGNVLSNWIPTISGGGVNAIAVDVPFRAAVYMGGAFTGVNDTSRNSFARTGLDGALK